MSALKVLECPSGAAKLDPQDHFVKYMIAQPLYHTPETNTE